MDGTTGAGVAAQYWLFPLAVFALAELLAGGVADTAKFIVPPVGSYANAT